MHNVTAMRLGVGVVTLRTYAVRNVTRGGASGAG